jgi:hypothetical protein
LDAEPFQLRTARFEFIFETKDRLPNIKARSITVEQLQCHYRKFFN